MTAERATKPVTLRDKALKVLINAPWAAVATVARALWGFRVIGRENIPAEGPYIVCVTEPGLLGVFLSGYIAIAILWPELSRNRDNAVSYMQEELWSLPAVGKILGARIPGKYRALIPHSAGTLAWGLLDGYRALLNKGLVVINPQGEATWDGRMVPHGRSVAWLALRTAAPILPALTTIGAYEIWPHWQRGPSRRGDLKIIIGEPFRVVEEPVDSVTEEEMARARKKIEQVFEGITYGPGGVPGWIGPILRNGAEVTEPVRLPPPNPGPQPRREPQPGGSDSKPGERRGVARLLWQCPVCRTDEALLHKVRRGRPHRITCQACGTLWDLSYEPGHDRRLKVVDGPADLVGLDMPLAVWYEHMKTNWQPRPVQVSGVSLLPGEDVYLEQNPVPLSPYRPNALFEGWAEPEAPKTQALKRHEYADWATLAEGRLLVTSHRLLWQNAERELSFYWSSVTAVYLWLADVLGVKYGSASYRFKLGDVRVLKWLFHACELAKKAGAANGHRVTVSFY